MADSNSQAPRCSCGFWGTPQTGGMCSKCYKEREKKLGDDNVVSGATSLAAASRNTPLEQAMSSSSIQDSAASKSDSACTSDSASREDSEDQVEKESETEAASVENGGASKRDISEVQDAAESELPIQKNKKRCFKCNCKLELAIREIGRCKCNYVFCQLHRLPEQHDCVFDHKEKGRKDALQQMVSPKKHAGTSIRRMDSCS